MTPHLLIRHSLDFGDIELVPMQWDGTRWVSDQRRGVVQGVVLVDGTVTVPPRQRCVGPVSLRYVDHVAYVGGPTP